MLPLRIRIHAELPQWITSSDRAAYHPATRTIHIKRSCLSVRVVLHELCHWFIHCAGLPERFHRALDHHSLAQQPEPFMSKYIVWRKDADREDGKQIEADYERQAAEKWAEWRDAWSADYTIVGGEEAEVCVALDQDGSDHMCFRVRGESVPVYIATLIFPV